MPLVNELVIGLKDKDRFNASQPRNDAPSPMSPIPHFPKLYSSFSQVPALRRQRYFPEPI